MIHIWKMKTSDPSHFFTSKTIFLLSWCRKKNNETSILEIWKVCNLKKKEIKIALKYAINELCLTYLKRLYKNMKYFWDIHGTVPCERVRMLRNWSWGKIGIGISNWFLISSNLEIGKAVQALEIKEWDDETKIILNGCFKLVTNLSLTLGQFVYGNAS